MNALITKPQSIFRLRENRRLLESKYLANNLLILVGKSGKFLM